MVLSAFVIYDYGSLFRQKKTAPPTRNIVHEDKFGKIEQFNLTIEKLGINVPIIPNVDGTNKEVYNDALKNGVAHYKNTALPNSGSNIVIFGHSSTASGVGEYADIFATLNKLKEGDEIIINFNQKQHVYTVSEKIIIAPDDISVILPTEREELTLLTCWPVGTIEKRLAVIAKPK